METLTRGQEETERFGERLSASLADSDVVYLFGALGSGKTCLARGVARGLGVPPREVASPTFALLHEYTGAGGGVVLRHLDLYRLEDRPNELEPLGLPGAVGGAPVLVEWPNRSLSEVLPPTMEVSFEVLGDGARKISVRSLDRSPAL